MYFAYCYQLLFSVADRTTRKARPRTSITAITQ